jgi:hypothetical protein
MIGAAPRVQQTFDAIPAAKNGIVGGHIVRSVHIAAKRVDDEFEEPR